MRLTSTLLRLAGLLALVASCRDSTAPIVTAGQFAITSINAQPVPYRVGADTIYSGALDIGKDGRYNAVTCYSADNPCSAPIIAYRNRIEQGTYAVKGDTITLHDGLSTTVRVLRVQTPEQLVEVVGALTIVYDRHPE